MVTQTDKIFKKEIDKGNQKELYIIAGYSPVVKVVRHNGSVCNFIKLIVLLVKKG